MKYIFLIILVMNIYAQDYADEIILTSTAIIFGVASGYSEAYRLNERYGTSYTESDRALLNKKWHDYALLRNAAGLTLGVEIGLLEKKTLPIIVDILSSAMLFWFVNDGVMNLKRGQPWFRQADTKFNTFENINTPVIKISVVVLALLLKYIKVNYLVLE